MHIQTHTCQHLVSEHVPAGVGRGGRFVLWDGTGVEAWNSDFVKGFRVGFLT